MPRGDDAIDILRAALAVSPDNSPLRRHLADSLAKLGRHAEAADELRTLLASRHDDEELKLDLADSFYQQAKNSEALVIVEDVVRRNDAPPRAHLLYCRLLLQAGETARAVAQYKQAIDLDPDVADAELAERLGIDGQQDSEVYEGRMRAAADDRPAGGDVEVERPRIRFDDVGGMDAVKEEIRLKIIYPMQHADMYAAYGKSVGGGILMYGPPGCGKTYLARATAGEIKAGFLSIGISDVLDMWLGNSERRLHELFARARQTAPCVVFIDEVDALGGRRSDMRAGAGRHLINQFLAEMDGVEYSNEGVLILAATNAPWHVDPAFRRPGRFDRVLFVPPPDAPARADILRLLCAGKPTRDVDFDYLSKKAPDFSGADLKAAFDVAVELRLKEAMKHGRLEPVTGRDLLAAVKTLRPSTREWFSTARNYALYSNQGGMYDDVLKHMKP